ncbi:MAG: TetR/AcrR family transcriptional regulator [Proteobacteria bacterium]|nr:TetR/AcrR family transcriptional regulator [Pseudomonadota bacterium]
MESPKRRDVRRHATREKLLSAARDLFFSADYFELSVDEIAKAAGLSRAAFYLHYPDKEAILVDIVREGSSKLDVVYRWFETNRNPTKGKLREFVRLVVRVSRRSKLQLSLFYRAAFYNSEIWQTFALSRDRHIEMLGESIPAFRINASAQKPREKQRLARAHLLFYQLEQLSLYAAFAEHSFDVDAEVEILANSIAAFIADFS